MFFAAFLLLAYLKKSDAQCATQINIQRLIDELSLMETDTTSNFQKLYIQDSLIDLIKYKYEYLSNVKKYEIALQSKDRAERIQNYRVIMEYPYYKVKNGIFGVCFYNLYLDAARNLIFELRGNLDALNKINIVPSASGELFGLLKLEIENAGGHWDKGEIVPMSELMIRGARDKH